VLVEPAGSSLKARPSGSKTSLGLAGAEWTVQTLGENPVPAQGAPTLAFDGTRRAIAGSTGCGRFLGTYAPGRGYALKLEPSGMTLAACSDTASLREEAFLEALRATTS
jgi:heat shock protein HslJ